MQEESVSFKTYKKLYFREPLNENNPQQVHARVARFLAQAEPEENREAFEMKLLQLMNDHFMLPNSPTLMNAGFLECPQTSACFVGNLRDDLDSIIESDAEAGRIYKRGSGIGLNYGNLRQEFALLSTGGHSCLTGDTVVYVDRPKRKAARNSITIADLYSRCVRGKILPKKLRCMVDDGLIGTNALSGVVHNGLARVYLMTTKLGYQIKATTNHRFLSEEYGWKMLRDFLIGEKIAINGAPRKEVGNPRLMKEVIFDEITEIKYVGEEEVFDLQMEPPFHNFIANGFVSHNSGPFPFMVKGGATCGAIKQGGTTRRAAKMAMFWDWHPQVEEFVDLKATPKGRELFQNMNLSIAVSEAFMEAVVSDGPWDLKCVVTGKVLKTISARSLFNRIAHNACTIGEPGIWFVDRSNEDNTLVKVGRIESCNPCVTGETLVAVADGRLYVPIRQLAEEGFDVPVHCVDPETRRSHVRMGRRPRLTRKGMPVFKVTLDDGSFIRVTEDHKFLRLDGSTAKTSELKPGDRLLSFTKYQQTNTTTGKNYWYVLSRDPSKHHQFPEHQMIADFVTPRPTLCHIPHHKNGDSLDNRPDNLEWLTTSEHNRIEPNITGRSGKENPMFGKRHSEESKNLIGAKTKRRCEDPDFRQRISETTKAGMTEEVREKLRQPRVVRLEYPCVRCGTVMQMTEAEYDGRATTNSTGSVFCSRACSTAYLHANGNAPKKANTIGKAIEDGMCFFEETAELPSYARWEQWRKNGKGTVCSRESIRKLFGGFGPFGEAVHAAAQPENHTVVSIEPDGIEDVFNITVDDFHTVAYVTNKSATTRVKGFPKIWGLYTRQCGEQPLLPYESCSLAHDNVAKFAGPEGFDWKGYAEVVRMTARLLDNQIDFSGYPTEKYRDMARNARPIGVGLMGFADALLIMGIPYGSSESCRFAEKLGRFMTRTAIMASAEMAMERDPFPLYEENKESTLAVAKKFFDLSNREEATEWEYVEKWGLRNSQWTTIAPTGSVSLAAECSQGMEPMFALCYDKSIADSDDVWTFVNPIFEAKYSKEPWYKKAIREIVENHGSCQGTCVPKKIQKVFVAAHDLEWRERVEMQAAFQRGISSAISSTINLPKGTEPATVAAIYMRAWELRLKGLTIYVDGSMKGQPISFGKKEEEEAAKEPAVIQERPRVLGGKTHKIRTAHGSLYITVNKMNGRVYEVFANGGKNGSEDSVNIEALTRAMSISLQSGTPIDAIVETLIGLNSGQGVWDKLDDSEEKSVLIKSTPDAVARILQHHYSEREKPVQPVEHKEDGLVCPTCGGPASYQQGCLFCPTCGSACG